MRVFIVFVIVILAMSIGVWFALTQPALTRNNTVSIVSMSEDRLEKHTRALSETFFPRDYTHPENLDRAAAYIRQEFEHTGGTISEQPYEMEGKPYRNVIVSFGPDSKERIVVGAHYDAFGELPAADDNASGVAGLIELAALLGKASLPL
ncbi:MAG: M28 family peptidase, partial [Acidobacteria bacterium]|nr:M28 family peptidase [Acidobacteriota bacterium]